MDLHHIQRLGWADLQEELLEEIASHLFARDVQSFSLVCRSWNEAVDDFYRLCPCLMMYHRGKRMWKFYQHERSFFMSIPELDSSHIRSSNYGWVLMSRDDRTLFFFDPFSRRRMELPGTKDDDYTTIHFFNEPTSPECFLVGIKNEEIESEKRVKIGILKRGKDCWESFICTSKHLFTVTLSAPVLRKGLLYFVDVKGNVATLDVDRVESSWTVHTRCLPFHRLRNKIRQHFLFQMVDERMNDEEKVENALYAVFIIDDNERVNLFRMSEEEMKWEFVEIMGARSLYLSQGSSFGHFIDFSIKADSIFLPRFKLESDELVVYRVHSETYFPYSLDHNQAHPTSYGLRKLDMGVTWILPSCPTHYDVPAW